MHRGFIFYVAHPIRSIETRSLPNSLAATLAALPSMSLVPPAPFIISSRCGKLAIAEFIE
jgi:hypothetical protein